MASTSYVVDWSLGLGGLSASDVSDATGQLCASAAASTCGLKVTDVTTTSTTFSGGSLLVAVRPSPLPAFCVPAPQRTAAWPAAGCSPAPPGSR